MKRVPGLALLLCSALTVATTTAAEPAPQPPATRPVGLAIPKTWKRGGLVLPRQDATAGEKSFSVSGDPCIVWDEEAKVWRMVLFYAPPGSAHATCPSLDKDGRGAWKVEGPLPVANPQVAGPLIKPFVVMNPDHPNHAAKIDGRYCLLAIGEAGNHKQVRRAWSDKLAGPWTFEAEPVVPVGKGGDFDAKHADAVTGYYFADRKEFLYFYMGYPYEPQKRSVSPFGSAQAVATQKLGAATATKLGPVLPPEQVRGHWASGWVGGLQLHRGSAHRWVAVVNASPTAPDFSKKESWVEEPAPSLGGFAWCDEAWPTKGWHFEPQPIEWARDIPKSALDAGEGHNLWRQFIHVLPDGRPALFYNSGFYGREQLYMKVGE